jgi:hypothetical protein
MSRYLSPSNEPNEQIMNTLSRIEGALIDLYVMVQDVQTKNDQLEIQVSTLIANTTPPTEIPPVTDNIVDTETESGNITNSEPPIEG